MYYIFYLVYVRLPLNTHLIYSQFTGKLLPHVQLYLLLSFVFLVFVNTQGYTFITITPVE